MKDEGMYSKEEMSYFESLVEVNLIREISLYFDLETIQVLEEVYSEKSSSWISEIFWRHYWYTHRESVQK